MKKYAFFIIIVIIFILPVFSYPKTLKLVNLIYLDQANLPIGRIYDFAIDENRYIYIPDSGFANIKIYNSQGRLVHIFGQKGAGPFEFIDPTGISLSSNRIVIADVGQLKYIIFDRNFNELGRLFYLMSGLDFIVNDKNIIANEYYQDKSGKSYKGVIINIESNKIKGLIKLKKKPSDPWEAIIDSRGFLAKSKDGKIILVKASKVQLFMFDEKGKFIKNFGVQPDFFIPPKRTKDFEEMIKWGRAPQGIEAGRKWYQSSSWVSGIFMLEKCVGILIKTFNLKENKWEGWIQLYDLNGELIEKGYKLTQPGSLNTEDFYVNSDGRDNIYILEITNYDFPKYIIYQYSIEL